MENTEATNYVEGAEISTMISADGKQIIGLFAEQLHHSEQ